MKQLFLKKEARIPFTQEGYDKIVAEKAALVAERPDAVDHLSKARAMGDLSENGYYHAAKSRLTGIDARLRKVDRLIKLAVIVASHGTGRVEIGSTVKISDGTKEYEYAIVGGYESDPSKNTISHISPLGKALLNKEAGAIVHFETPKGIRTYTILKVI